MQKNRNLEMYKCEDKKCTQVVMYKCIKIKKSSIFFQVENQKYRNLEIKICRNVEM